tara:strand:- start:27 stop:701 length:675 start_codon:yes stop_codon:yes gene_type:complete
MGKIYLVSKSNLWSNNLYHMLVGSDINCSYFTDDSYIDNVEKDKPEWIFFFHWSKIVSSEIHTKYRCVVFHTGNLPDDRGGTPIQNQILNKVVETKVNAITMEEEVDSGDVYCSLPITLQGNLNDIWLSITERVYKLIHKCILDNPVPVKQVEGGNVYKRNKDNELPLESTNEVVDLYRFIQMLDGDGYPKAFLEVGNFRLEFSRSKIEGNNLVSDVTIRKKYE